MHGFHQHSDVVLSGFVEMGTGCGLSREEADWASRSSSAATSPGRLTRFSLSGEAVAAALSLPGVAAPLDGTPTRSV